MLKIVRGHLIWISIILLVIYDAYYSRVKEGHDIGTHVILVLILIGYLIDSWDEMTKDRMNAKFDKSIENLVILELYGRSDELDEVENKKIRTIAQRLRKEDDLRYLLRSCYEQICAQYTKDGINSSADDEEIIGKVVDLVIEQSVKIIFADKVDEAMSYVLQDEE